MLHNALKVALAGFFCHSTFVQAAALPESTGTRVTDRGAFWREREETARYDSAGDEIYRDRYAHAHHIIPFDVVEHERNLRGLFPVDRAAGDESTLANAVSLFDGWNKQDSVNSSDAVATERQTGRQGGGASTAQLDLIGVGGTISYLAEVSIGGRGPFSLVIDTGSSDTWVRGPGFKCLDGNMRVVQAAQCDLGPAYQPSESFKQHMDKHLSLRYADSEVVLGAVGEDTVKVGELVVPSQRINVIDHAHWRGDGKSSGLLGLGFPANTANYAGPILTDISQPLIYDPIVTTAIKRNIIPRGIFAIALHRDESALQKRQNAATIRGGFLSFGGVPTTTTYGDVVQVPMSNPRRGGERTEYDVEIDGFKFPGSDRVLSSTGGPTGAFGTPGGKIDALIDSGTSIMLAPPEVVQAYNRLWNPNQPGSQPPPLSIVIGGREFPIDPRDIKLVSRGGRAGTALQASRKVILGDTFMRNVVSVFDITGEKMRFASTNPAAGPAVKSEGSI